MNHDDVCFTNANQAIKWAIESFDQAELYYGHGTDNAYDEALWLTLSVLGLSWDISPEALDMPLNPNQSHELYKIYQTRMTTRQPAAYLTGSAWFAGLEFTVNNDVLVPRSPLAEFIVSGFSPWLPKAPVNILDLCTGSGCIGIACALYLEASSVDLSDISSKALVMAEQNIARYQLNERVRTIKSDGFNGIDDQYDLIISNPPYVDEEDLNDMPAEYHAEPALGLASGLDGLDFTRKMLAQASHYLTPEGTLLVEVGNSAGALADAYPNLPFTWLECANGGHGIFMLTKQELSSSI